MRKKSHKVKWVSGIAMIAICGVAGYFWLQHSGDARAEETTIIPYSVKELSVENNQESSLLLTGAIEPKKVSKILVDSSRGKVVKLHVKLGDTVKKGQKLLTYENPDGDFEIQESEFAITQLQQQIGQKETDIANKQNSLYEKQTLVNNLDYKISKATEEEKEGLKTERETAKEAVSQLNAEILSTQSEASSLTIDLEKAQYKLETVKKKFENKDQVAEADGVVKKMDESLLNQTDEAAGKAIIELVDLSTYYVKGVIDEFQKEQLQLNAKVEVVDRNDDTQKWSGKLVEIGDISNEAKDDSENGQDENPNMTKYPFKVMLDKADKYPTLGRHVFVRPQPKENSKVQLPREYIFTEKESDYVWKIVDNKVKRQKVVIENKTKESLWAIKEGLTMNDQVTLPVKGVEEKMEVGAVVKTQ
ncbi:HlyD family secretion protein [Enterococcus sp. AZ194]|uniref:efflux RND transporter periplasmic adaptor subunit n=1 Tax=Enterococcus sp. AZ194 TaxID=2774629 RepID=UPI003F1FE348